MKHPFQNLIIEGQEAPNAKPSVDTLKVVFSKEILKEYIPIWQKIEANYGIKLLALIMAQKEGFEKGSRSYRTNNPANMGNVDSGVNVSFPTLKSGIEHQIKTLTRIALGNHKAYPINKMVELKPFYSKEIAANKTTYQLEPYCPGYKFYYTGRLDQFIKIYATGPRQKNTYLSLIRSYFKNQGFEIKDSTTLQTILEIDGK